MAGGQSSRLRARMIAEPACSCTRWVSVISIFSNPAVRALPELGFGECSGDTAGPGRHVRARLLVHVGVGDHVGDGEPAAGPQHAGRLFDDPRLVAGQVDHAVGDDHIHGFVVEGHVLEVALDELDVLDAGRGGVGSRELEHLIGHVEPDRPAVRPDPPGGDQDVRTGARPKIQDRLAIVQVGHRRGHSAPQRRADRRLRRAALTAAGVQRSAEHASVLGRPAARCARRGGRAAYFARTVSRTCSAVAVTGRRGCDPAEHPQPLAWVAAARCLFGGLTAGLLRGRGAALVVQLSHADSSSRASGIT